MMMKIKSILLFCLLGFQISFAQEEQNIQIRPFIAFEIGEAVFNKFQSLSGEVGIKFPNNKMLRLTHMNVNLTEGHLSSSFAGAVDGNDVEGKFFGFELFYDFPIFFEGLYISPSIGYYKNEYNHIILSENLKNKSATIGVGISYKQTNIFGLGGLYYMVSIPFRTPLNPIKDTKLGDATINNNTFDNNIWLFIGYEF